MSNFRLVLLQVNNQLSNQQTDCLKFLSRAVISNARMDRIQRPLDLFNALEERGHLSSDNVDFLRHLLQSAGCDDALKELRGIHPTGTQMDPKIKEDFLFRSCLLRIALELNSNEFDSLKFFLKERLKQSTDQIYTATVLFQLLIQRQIVTSSDLRTLHDLLFSMGRKDLCDHINQYMTSIRRQSYQMLNQGVPTDLYMGPSHHLPTPVEESPANQPFRTISSGVRTNQASLESNLSPMSSGGVGRQTTNSSLASTPGPMSGNREPGLTSPPLRVDSGHGMRSMPSNSSLDSSYPSSSTTVSSLESQRSGMAYGSNFHEYRLPHSSSGQFAAHGLEYGQQNYGQGYGQMQSPPAHLGYSSVHPHQVPVPYSQPSHPQDQYGHQIQSNITSRDVQVSQGIHAQVQSSALTEIPSNQVIDSKDEHLQSPFAKQFLTFKLDEDNQRASQNQLLQKELAQKDHELRAKEQDIDQYQRELAEMQAHISSVQDQQKGKEEEYVKKITDLEGILKDMTTEAEIQRRDMQQLHHQLQLANPRSTHDDTDFYTMNKSPHGICLIINNYKFYHADPSKKHPDRGGADVDVHNLSQTFKYLCYRIELAENVTSEGMQEMMLEMATRDHSNYDSFVCCILTHGERDVVHGSDCEAVNLHDLAGVMKMCKSLRGKPKLFFVQACRGELETKGFELPERDTGGGPYSNTIPQEADFYFGFATPIGSSAYRSRRYGSWFISEVCQVFIKHAYTHDLGGMMTKVNKNVSDAYTKDGYKQSPESVDRLRFRVHFFRFLQSRVAVGGQ